MKIDRLWATSLPATLVLIVTLNDVPNWRLSSVIKMNKMTSERESLKCRFVPALMHLKCDFYCVFNSPRKNKTVLR